MLKCRCFVKCQYFCWSPWIEADSHILIAPFHIIVVMHSNRIIITVQLSLDLILNKQVYMSTSQRYSPQWPTWPVRLYLQQKMALSYPFLNRYSQQTTADQNTHRVYSRPWALLYYYPSFHSRSKSHNLALFRQKHDLSIQVLCFRWHSYSLLATYPSVREDKLRPARVWISVCYEEKSIIW